MNTIAAALLALSTLVLGESATVSGVAVTRATLFGFRLSSSAQVLDAEEAAAEVVRLSAAVAPAPKPGLVRVAQPSLARTIDQALRAARRPTDGTYRMVLRPLAGGVERVEVRYEVPRGTTSAEVKREWLARAAAALNAVGLLAGQENGVLMVMWSAGERRVA